MGVATLAEARALSLQGSYAFSMIVTVNSSEIEPAVVGLACSISV
jgi:hypothetical protein